MLLTRKKLEEYLRPRRIAIPNALKEKLLNKYGHGHTVIDDEGHVFEYTEQDIYEQTRKIIIDETKE